jgi:predicted glycosyltransferase
VGTLNVLYISGSVGLGHAMRDVAIANKLRRVCRDVEISWLASGPAKMLLEERKDTLLEESDSYYDVNEAARFAAKGTSLNLFRYGKRAAKGWLHNIALFKKILSRYSFDLVVADEAYEISYYTCKAKRGRRPPFVEIVDFIGFEPMSGRPAELLQLWVMNRIWARAGKKHLPGYHTLFVGEPDDVPDERFGFFLPRKREYANQRCTFLGYVLGFEPEDYKNRDAIKNRLGYGKEPLVVCSSGGSPIGKELLRLCRSAYPLLRRRVPNLRMVLVCGPGIQPEEIESGEGVTVKGFVPNLYEHFAASDIAVVQGGGSTTLELTALQRPFIYFPLEDHFEQQRLIPARLLRHGAGIRMSYSETAAESLSEKVCANIGRMVDYREIPLHGARKAAEYISATLKGGDNRDSTEYY